MTKVGIISDTHGTVDDKTLNHLKHCDQIWHAGDIGDPNVLVKLESIAPIKAVYGNIDDHSVRSLCPENQIFELEQLKVLITHIAGYPGRYNGRVKKLIAQHRPNILICGHSHILKVLNDPTFKHLHINPGAAGNAGFHKIKTIIRFQLDAGQMSHMEVVEMKR